MVIIVFAKKSHVELVMKVNLKKLILTLQKMIETQVCYVKIQLT